MRTYNYSEIALVPSQGILTTRSLANTKVEFAGREWNNPIVPANMSCSISFELADELQENGYFYILHRFYLYSEILYWIEGMNERNSFVSISVGISSLDKLFIEQAYKMGLLIDCLTIDVAHGHHESVLVMMEFIKSFYPDTFLIVGNVATPDAVDYLQEADAVKVGVGPGKACSTFTHTGFGTIGMFTVVQDCVTVADQLGIKVIADGGIRNNGDMAKAIAAGADMVMVGSLFAELSDSPAETIYKEKLELIVPELKEVTNMGDGIYHTIDKQLRYNTVQIPIGKTYFGSASEFQKGHSNHVEGVKIELPYNPMSYLEKMKEINQDLSSAISYAGGTEIEALRSVLYNTLQ